jgi:TusE/DsrC/DsvC family sulfur relay protein
MTTIDVNGKSFEIDNEGYLAKYQDWNEAVGQALADIDNIKITDAHWTVIRLMRESFLENEVIPTAKDLLKIMAEKLGPEKGTHKYLNSLFPHEPLKQCGKIAGLPMLSGCM